MNLKKEVLPYCLPQKKLFMLTIQNISYFHPNKDLLFRDLTLTINKADKIALIGKNGVGKSTLLKIIARDLLPDKGQVITDTKPYYIPQIFGQFNHLTIAQALQVDEKLNALHEILKGNVDEKNFSLLNDDWTIEDRCQEAISYWGISDLALSQKLSNLSGGQKTKVFLAGMTIHQPEFVVLDEPSNHLDQAGRKLLYDFIQSSPSTLIIVSHDRQLLQLLNPICELHKDEIKTYGGDYNFYKAQKQIEFDALHQNIRNKEKALRKAREKKQKTVERQNRLDSRGKKKQGKAGMGKGMLDKMKNDAENSTARLKNVHSEKISGIKDELQDLRLSVSVIDQMRFQFDNSNLHRGKNLFIGQNINFRYEKGRYLWEQSLNIQIQSGERVVIHGKNGSGKTTLIKIILGELQPSKGSVFIAENRSVYIDQDYSLIDDDLQIYEQARQFNRTRLQEHKIKIRLNRFLFSHEDWEKPCRALSGGERMRLMLCCLNIANQSPDIIMLDEPTNNLDIQNIEILTRAINEYEGTLLVISHDKIFLKDINMERGIEL